VIKIGCYEAFKKSNTIKDEAMTAKDEVIAMLKEIKDEAMTAKDEVIAMLKL
jgi:hypothetical protein